MYYRYLLWSPAYGGLNCHAAQPRHPTLFGGARGTPQQSHDRGQSSHVFTPLSTKEAYVSVHLNPSVAGTSKPNSERSPVSQARVSGELIRVVRVRSRLRKYEIVACPFFCRATRDFQLLVCTFGRHPCNYSR